MQNNFGDYYSTIHKIVHFFGLDTGWLRLTHTLSSIFEFSQG